MKFQVCFLILALVGAALSKNKFLTVQENIENNEFSLESGESSFALTPISDEIAPKETALIDFDPDVDGDDDDDGSYNGCTSCYDNGAERIVVGAAVVLGAALLF